MNGSERGDGTSVRNDVASSIAGHSVQAGEIHGDVHFHQRIEQQATVIPRQLPSAARHFVNRAVEQDALTTLLNRTTADGVVVLSAIDGVAGVGKSALVVHWAHQVRDRFPDGELYVNLRGFDPVAEPLAPVEAVGIFLAALGVSQEQIPAGLDARAALFRSLVHDKRTLILLDNVRSADQVRPLLPSSPNCLVLVTSRNRLDDLVVHEGAFRLSLDVLTDPEARDLFGRYIGQERLAAESDAIEALIECCAGLPLALGIVAVRAVANPDFPLDDLVAELQDERERLDVLDVGGETGVRAVFSWSYHSLSAKSARLFRLLGLPTGPDISLTAAACLAGITTREARKLLGELTRAHLLESHAPHRYRFHDLLRAYAGECAADDESAEDRHAAIRRLLDHYLLTSRSIEQRFLSHSRKFVPELPDSAVEGVTFQNNDDAVRWWDAERANMLAATRHAAAIGLHEHAWQIPHTLMHFFNLRNQLDDLISNYNVALASARHLGDSAAEAHLLADVAGAYYALKHYEQAARRWESALPLLRQVGSDHLHDLGLLSHAYCHLRAERFADAVEPLRRGLDAQLASGDLNGQGYAHAGFGLLHTGRCEFERAFEHFEDALRLYREVGESWGEGFVLNNLADAYTSADRLDDAARTYQQAAAHREEIGHRQGQAVSLRGLGTVLRESGDAHGARGAWEQAVLIFDEVDATEASHLRSVLEGVESSVESNAAAAGSLSANSTDDHGQGAST